MAVIAPSPSPFVRRSSRLQVDSKSLEAAANTASAATVSSVAEVTVGITVEVASRLVSIQPVVSIKRCTRCMVCMRTSSLLKEEWVAVKLSFHSIAAAAATRYAISQQKLLLRLLLRRARHTSPPPPRYAPPYTPSIWLAPLRSKRAC